MRKSFRPTVAPRCQHTCNAVLLRVDDGDVVVFVVAVVLLFGVEIDVGVVEADCIPHDSSPSSDEPLKEKSKISLKILYFDSKQTKNNTYYNFLMFQMIVEYVALF